MPESPEMGSSPVLRHLVQPEDPAFKGFFELYTEAIPVRERKPISEVRGLCQRPDYRLLVLEAGSRVVGLSVLFLPPKEPFFLLEYMAVSGPERNRGLGAGLFTQSLAVAKGDLGRTWALLEVEATRGRHAEQDVRERRQRFYRRLGCARVEGLDYILPLPGEGDPPSMDLLVHAPGAQTGMSPRLGSAELWHWLRLIYSGVYGCSTEDHRLRLMMENLGDEVRLC